MSKQSIKYKSNFKYQLVGDYSVQTRIITGRSIKAGYIELTATGKLTLKSGYACDGASSVAIDTKTIMRAAFGHDGKYELIRKGLIGMRWRKVADEELREDCLKDGMNPIRAWWVYKAVQIGGKASASPKSRKKVYTAP